MSRMAVGGVGPVLEENPVKRIEGEGPSERKRLPIGAEVLVEGKGVAFRVWAPRRKAVAVVIEGGEGVALDGQATIPLESEGDGYFSGVVPAARTGSLYHYKLDGDATFPDPASRFQPEGPHGPSMVVDPSAFAWSDSGWKGIELQGQVLYELHIGDVHGRGDLERGRCGTPRVERPRDHRSRDHARGRIPRPVRLGI